MRITMMAFSRLQMTWAIVKMLSTIQLYRKPILSGPACVMMAARCSEELALIGAQWEARQQICFVMWTKAGSPLVFLTKLDRTIGQPNPAVYSCVRVVSCRQCRQPRLPFLETSQLRANKIPRAKRYHKTIGRKAQMGTYH
jgi:hypothetical protein